MEKEFYYNSVTLNRELHIAATFIYDALDLIYHNNNDYRALDEPEFNILYKLAVGVERFQKISIVLSQGIRSQEDLDNSQYIKQLKRHNHRELNNIIDNLNSGDLIFNENEKKIIRLLTEFYSNYRYGNYKFTSLGDETKELVFKTLNKIYGDNKSYDGSNVYMSLEIIKLMNRMFSLIGNIVDKYNTMIKNIMKDKFLFTTESESHTKYFILTYYGGNIKFHFLLKDYTKLEFSYYLEGGTLEDFSPLNFDPANKLNYINLLNGYSTCTEMIDACTFELAESYEIDDSDEKVLYKYALEKRLPYLYSNLKIEEDSL